MQTDKEPTRDRDPMFANWCTKIISWRCANNGAIPRQRSDDEEERALAKWVSKALPRRNKAIGSEPSKRQLTDDEVARLDKCLGDGALVDGSDISADASSSAIPDVAPPPICVPQPEPKCTMMLQRQHGEAIRDGRKLWEGRPKGNPGTVNIRPGVYIKLRLGSLTAKFPYLLVKVTEMREFAHAREMLSVLGIAALLPDGPATLDKAVAVYHNLGEKYEGRMVAYKLADPWLIQSEEAECGLKRQAGAAALCSASQLVKRFRGIP